MKTLIVFFFILSCAIGFAESEFAELIKNLTDNDKDNCSILSYNSSYIEKKFSFQMVVTPKVGPESFFLVSKIFKNKIYLELERDELNAISEKNVNVKFLFENNDSLILVKAIDRIKEVKKSGLKPIKGVSYNRIDTSNVNSNLLNLLKFNVIGISYDSYTIEGYGEWYFKQRKTAIFTRETRKEMTDLKLFFACLFKSALELN